MVPNYVTCAACAVYVLMYISANGLTGIDSGYDNEPMACDYSYTLAARLSKYDLEVF